MAHELTVKDVCCIISTCRKSGVSSLSYSGLEVTFGDTEKVKQKKNNKQLEKEIPKIISTQEYDIKQDQLEEMIITDPVQYEKLMQQGEIVDARIENSGLE